MRSEYAASAYMLRRFRTDVIRESSSGRPLRPEMADLKCHRAWMRLAPANMDACPLDLAGLSVEATGSADGITLTLTVRDRMLIPELQRRVAHDLEIGAGHANH